MQLKATVCRGCCHCNGQSGGQGNWQRQSACARAGMQEGAEGGSHWQGHTGGGVDGGRQGQGKG